MSTGPAPGTATPPPRCARPACSRSTVVCRSRSPWSTARRSRGRDVKIALDPTPFHHDYELLDFPKLVAELGYEYLQLTPHRDFIPFFNHPRADDVLVGKFRK